LPSTRAGGSRAASGEDLVQQPADRAGVHAGPALADRLEAGQAGHVLMHDQAVRDLGQRGQAGREPGQRAGVVSRRGEPGRLGVERGGVRHVSWCPSCGCVTIVTFPGPGNHRNADRAEGGAAFWAAAQLMSKVTAGERVASAASSRPRAAARP
jgi:hypothetical protein